MKWFRYGAGVLLFLSLFLLPDPNKNYLFMQTIAQMTRESFEEVKPRFKEGTCVIQLKELNTEQDVAAIERDLKRIIVKELEYVFIDRQKQTWRLINNTVAPCDRVEQGNLYTLSLKAVMSEDAGSLEIKIPECDFSMSLSKDFFRLYSLLPPMFAILLALLFQKTILALFFGVWLGATLLEGMNPIAGMGRFMATYFYEQSLCEEFRLDIIGFVVALCATVGVLTRGAGVKGFVEKLMGFAKTVRSTQMVTYLMGLGIFFDDYANCIIVGNTLRPLTDKLKIAREKLAYIVDSTAAPIAGLSMLSTWIAYEVSTFATQLPEASALFPEANIPVEPYTVFAQTIPFRFYCIFTLFFILFMIYLQRDFGPMRKAEQRARSGGGVIRKGGQPLTSASLTKLNAKEGVPARWYNAFLPIGFIILITMEELWRSGGGFDLPLNAMFSWESIRTVLGNASATRPIFTGAVSGLILAIILMLSQRILTPKECLVSAYYGAKALIFAICILFLAWCIGGVCADIGTAHYLIALFKGIINPVLFPSILFITSCIVAFATGSSWSTMSILLPNTVIFAATIGEASSIGSLEMLVISIGAVLEGSIFGDHCSPISDTTILSSVSSASDHMDHIKTQAPYAIFTMVVAILVGYIPASMGFHPALSLLLGVAILFIGILLMGKKVSKSAPLA